VLKDDLGEPNI